MGDLLLSGLFLRLVFGLLGFCPLSPQLSLMFDILLGWMLHIFYVGVSSTFFIHWWLFRRRLGGCPASRWIC